MGLFRLIVQNMDCVSAYVLALLYPKMLSDTRTEIYI